MSPVAGCSMLAVGCSILEVVGCGLWIVGTETDPPSPRPSPPGEGDPSPIFHLPSPRLGLNASAAPQRQIKSATKMATPVGSCQADIAATPFREAIQTST